MYNVTLCRDDFPCFLNTSMRNIRIKFKLFNLYLTYINMYLNKYDDHINNQLMSKKLEIQYFFQSKKFYAITAKLLWHNQYLNS